MIVIGAKGHAKEVLDIVETPYKNKELYFFDNITNYSASETFNGYKLIKDIEHAAKILKNNKEFSLALGGTLIREKLFKLFVQMGGTPVNIIATHSFVSKYAVIGDGINLMQYSSILGNAKVGKGSLINAYASIHHDVEIGEFSEISPGVRILGNSRLGDRCTVGSNAVILPGCNIVSDVIIGAGAVVTKDITVQGVYVGIPAKQTN